MTSFPLSGLTFEKTTSKNCQLGKVYVYQRGLHHYVVFSREPITDMAAVDAISQFIARREASAVEGPPDEALGRAGADE